MGKMPEAQNFLIPPRMKSSHVPNSVMNLFIFDMVIGIGDHFWVIPLIPVGMIQRS